MAVKWHGAMIAFFFDFVVKHRLPKSVLILPVWRTPTISVLDKYSFHRFSVRNFESKKTLLDRWQVWFLGLFD
jgi:hypothetical protein